MVEHTFNCPYCWQDISMLLEPDQRNEEYIEDCEVCCRPIVIRQNCSEFELISFVAKPME